MATTCISRPSSITYMNRSKRGAVVVLSNTHICNYAPAAGKSGKLCLGNGGSSQWRRRRKLKYRSPVMEWQDCRSEIEVDIPCSVAYQCYSDRELIPQWMPFISSVTYPAGQLSFLGWSLISIKEQVVVLSRASLPRNGSLSSQDVLKDKPDLSRWSLKYNVFNQDVEFSWLARNLQPIPNQKIHWRSLEGLPNRGAVRFFPKGPSSCRIELTVSYEVPQVLAPVASALKPLLEGLLLNGLNRFAAVAKEYKKKEQLPK